jgi:hypothetical protein
LSIHRAEVILALEAALKLWNLRFSYDSRAIVSGSIAILMTPVIKFPRAAVSLVTCGLR